MKSRSRCAGRNSGAWASVTKNGLVEHFDVIVVGGGIAGLSTAWHLARAHRRVCVLERDWACATRASGLNAAIFRQLDFDRPGVQLAHRSRALMAELSATPLVRETGALYLADAHRLDEATVHLAAVGVTAPRWGRAELRVRLPHLASDGPGVFIPSDGVIDLHGVVQALQHALQGAGVPVRTSTEVTALTRGDDGWRVTTPRSELSGAQLVLAGGAWGAGLGALVGAPVPLTPRRRHLVLLETPSGLEAPVVWRLHEGREVYFRPESGGALASPCDETDWQPGLGEVPSDEQALQSLAELLHDFEPRLATSSVRRFWGCLRTFTPDRDFLAGADPRAPGVFWAAGLGGRGMTCGLALGEVVAAAVLGQSHPLHEALAPARFTAPRS